MEQEERVIPVEVINELLELSEDHFVTNYMLNSDDEVIRYEAEDDVQVLRDFLLSKGLTHEESDRLIEKSLRHSEFSLFDGGSSGFSSALVFLIISVAVTGLLAWLNYYLLSKHNSFWIFLIIINVVAAICVLVSLFSVLITAGIGIFDKTDKIKLLRKKNKMDKKDSFFEQNREYAEYLIKEHHYNENAIMFYFSDFVSDYFELKAFVEKLEFPQSKS